MCTDYALTRMSRVTMRPIVNRITDRQLRWMYWLYVRIFWSSRKRPKLLKFLLSESPLRRIIDFRICCQSSYYRPQRSCEGYVFTPFCHSVHRGGLPQCMQGYHIPPGTRHPSPSRPLRQTAIVADGTHPTGMHNAFLFLLKFLLKLFINHISPA